MGRTGLMLNVEEICVFSLVFQKPGDFHVMFCCQEAKGSEGWGGTGSSPFPVQLYLNQERAVRSIIKTKFEDVQSSFLAGHN